MQNPAPVQNVESYKLLLVVLLPVFDWSHVGEDEERAGNNRVNGGTHDGTDERLQKDNRGVWGGKS